MRPSTRPVVGIAVAAIATAWGASPAFAHIDPDPKEAPAGSEQSVGFTVEHGCDGSATVQLDMRLPDGVTNAVAEPPAGWTAAVARRVVTFVGGPLPADVEGTFRVRMTLPATPDATIYFPFVQRCEQGEIRWIDVPSDGSGTELDEPAPAMNLTAPAPTTTTTTPPTSTTTAPPTTTTAPTTSEPPAATEPATTVTTAPPSSTAAATSLPVDRATLVTSSVGGGEGGDDSASSGNVVAAGTAAAVAAVAGLAIWQVRRRRL
jgi:periplasmic copper chaperone A